LLFRWLQKIRGNTVRLEGNFATWEAAAARCVGYEDGEILSKVLAATLKIKQGEAAFERDSVAFDEIEYSWPVLATLMWTAARNGGKLNVLDFGGALGSSYFQNAKFLQYLQNVRWGVVEQHHFVVAGQQHIQNQHLRFYSSIEDCLRENQVNVVLLSGVLQYLPSPYDFLDKLIAVKAEAIILDRTCYSTSQGVHSIKVQHVPESIYKATYPCHILDEGRLCQFITTKGYELVESFGSLDEFDSNTAWRGHIFRRTELGTSK
jgi:putative methyltransferase (TIGR04325 family)